MKKNPLFKRKLSLEKKTIIILREKYYSFLNAGGGTTDTDGIPSGRPAGYCATKDPKQKECESAVRKSCGAEICAKRV